MNEDDKMRAVVGTLEKKLTVDVRRQLGDHQRRLAGAQRGVHAS